MAWGGWDGQPTSVSEWRGAGGTVNSHFEAIDTMTGDAAAVSGHENVGNDRSVGFTGSFRDEAISRHIDEVLNGNLIVGAQ